MDNEQEELRNYWFNLGGWVKITSLLQDILNCDLFQNEGLWSLDKVYARQHQ